MSEQLNSLDLGSLAESCDLECKSAQGRDGRGVLLRAYPKTNDPRQAYITSPNTEKEQH
ncbi:MAG: hypothetical protein Q8L45_11500 [Xanthomonadaceae bacterium]|nr:hypothetical protein [Xanthomonadaceae bacterium]MDP2184366.1 hypothetical protein [Xanthomonadales bacterium]MDZ4114589.1 hypothetical protein [Xanthomonadaceae bacterium]MDZ4379658.1 hypothetical protein [Xanthomonadaceae bacterium]